MKGNEYSHDNVLTFDFFVASGASVMPINDIRGIDSMMYAKGEKQLR